MYGYGAAGARGMQAPSHVLVPMDPLQQHRAQLTSKTGATGAQGAPGLFPTFGIGPATPGVWHFLGTGHCYGRAVRFVHAVSSGCTAQDTPVSQGFSPHFLQCRGKAKLYVKGSPYQDLCNGEMAAWSCRAQNPRLQHPEPSRGEPADVNGHNSLSNM